MLVRRNADSGFTSMIPTSRKKEVVMRERERVRRTDHLEPSGSQYIPWLVRSRCNWLMQWDPHGDLGDSNPHPQNPGLATDTESTPITLKYRQQFSNSTFLLRSWNA